MRLCGGVSHARMMGGGRRGPVAGVGAQFCRTLPIGVSGFVSVWARCGRRGAGSGGARRGGGVGVDVALHVDEVSPLSFPSSFFPSFPRPLGRWPARERRKAAWGRPYGTPVVPSS